MGLRCGQVHVLPEDEIAALSDEEHDMFYCLLQLVCDLVVPWFDMTRLRRIEERT